MTQEEKSKAAETARKNILKEFGEGSIFSMADKRGLKIPCIPTGLFDLDHVVIGAGGFPRGRMIELYGPESSGKTTLALQVVAQAQKAGGRAAFIDMEHALDPTWAGKQGVDIDALMVSQPDYGEQALEITENLIQSLAFDVIVIDSIAALVPKAELEADFETQSMGLHARLMSRACRKLTGIVNKSNTCLIFINQIREKIGVMYGNPETTTGGRAMKFYASLRLDIRRVETAKDGTKEIGNKVKVTARKNKVGTPFKSCETILLFSGGFDTFGGLFDAALLYGIIERKGAWFFYKGEQIGQGKDNSMVALRDKKEEILTACIAAVERL